VSSTLYREELSTLHGRGPNFCGPGGAIIWCEKEMKSVFFLSAAHSGAATRAGSDCSDLKFGWVRASKS